MIDIQCSSQEFNRFMNIVQNLNNLEEYWGKAKKNGEFLDILLMDNRVEVNLFHGANTLTKLVINQDGEACIRNITLKEMN